MLTCTTEFFRSVEDWTGPLAMERPQTALLLLAAARNDDVAWCVGHAAYLLATAWHEFRFDAHGICADPAALAAAMQEGTLTGRWLSQYILAGNGDAVAFRHCRKVVGGMDVAEEVAATAVRFAEALVAGGWQ